MIQTQKVLPQQLEQCSQLQKDELYAIQAIYLQDFEFIRNIHPYLFSVVVRPFVPQNYFSYQNHVVCRINIELPLEYPSKQQRFWFEIEGLTNHFNQELTQQAKQVCENVIKTYEKETEFQPIIFTVIEKLRDWLFDRSTYEQEMFDLSSQQYDEATAYVPLMPKFATHTPVTVENFTAWKKKFDQEMYESKKRSKQFLLEEEFRSKMSGRQFFEGIQQEILEEVVDDEDVEDLSDQDYQKEDDSDEEDDDYKPLYEREQFE